MSPAIPYNSSASDPDLQSSEVRERMQQGETLSTEPRQVPMVDLPLGATEDRLCGTIDIEKALSEGCLLYTSPSPRDYAASRMPSSA